MDDSFKDDLRLIEAGFPCHQVGAETQRERGASSALPPLYFLHVWWARRPLTPSRAAILASLLPADADTDLFLRDLGIERVQVNVNDVWWTIDDVKLKRLEKDQDGREWYRVDYWTLRWLEKENKQRQKMRKFLHQLQEDKLLLAGSKLLAYWEKEFSPIPEPFPKKEELLAVRRVSGKPAEFNALMELAKSAGKRVPNLYGYDRAYKQDPPMASEPITILDPTSGGGSIPFESLRLGNRAIANELNPVAAVILNATLDYPVRYGQELSLDILHFGQELLSTA
jgi:adenine-specific DNA methylase